MKPKTSWSSVKKHTALNWLRLNRINKLVERNSPISSTERPVVIFNASTRIRGLSLNAGFSLLSSWGLRLSGQPVIHFVCDSGLKPCLLGTKPDDLLAELPCKKCISNSNRLFNRSQVYKFNYQEDQKLKKALNNLGIDKLAKFEYQFDIESDGISHSIPLGSLVLPAMRWILRKHTLEDNDQNRYLFKQYILSAWSLGKHFHSLITKENPKALVVFNGIMYPEAVARWIAGMSGIPTITHEVGFQPFSAFFSHGDATAYPINIPEDFDLTESQERKLTNIMNERIEGEFTMAGIKFWTEMKSLSQNIRDRIKDFSQVVSVFTNVVFDTSQVHANVIFPDMFSWLDQIHSIIQENQDTLFIMRAHPDEFREGSYKSSRETVTKWVIKRNLLEFPNFILIKPEEKLSSYELIDLSKLVLVYNSSIGLEATILGKPVISGGKSRYTGYDTVIFPDSKESHLAEISKHLKSRDIIIPPEFLRNTKRYLYYQMFMSSLSFADFFESHPTAGYVNLKPFNLDALQPENSETLRIIRDGILENQSFLHETE